MSCICMYIPNIVKLSVLHFWEHLRPKDQLKRNFSAIIKDITVLYCNIETLHLLQVIVPFSTFVPPYESVRLFPAPQWPALVSLGLP